MACKRVCLGPYCMNINELSVVIRQCYPLRTFCKLWKFIASCLIISRDKVNDTKSYLRVNVATLML